MEEHEVALRKKAEIICSGKLLIPNDIQIPFPTSKSSAGPGAGNESLVIAFSRIRVKIPISRIEGNLVLRKTGDDYEIQKNEKSYITHVSLIPTLCHAPGQAFVSLGRSCRMNCLYCTINESGSKMKGEISVDDAFKLIIAAAKKKGFQAIAITSGVSTTVDEQIGHIAELITKAREAFPHIPVGVEPLITTRDQVKQLKNAGAIEIKVNIEAASKEIFRKICPERNYDVTLKAIKWAVDEFGKGRVTSNIILGLGETDEEVIVSLEMLAKIGAVGNLRAVRINDCNSERLKSALGSKIGIDEKRLLFLAGKQNQTLKKYKLSPSEFKTMCFPCGCCDLVPSIDF